VLSNCILRAVRPPHPLGTVCCLPAFDIMYLWWVVVDGAKEFQAAASIIELICCRYIFSSTANKSQRLYVFIHVRSSVIQCLSAPSVK